MLIIKCSNMKFDIFISYRRAGGFDTAKHLYDLLVRDGYRVSFDIDTLRNGNFDTQLLSRIEQCKDFILIVDEHAFDRTLDANTDPKNDWMRWELSHALKHKKNIVPVFLSGVTDFPKNLPDDIIEVTKKHAAKHDKEYFDGFYKKMCSMLTSRSRKFKAMIACALLLIVGLAALLICNYNKDSSTIANEWVSNSNTSVGRKQIDIVEQHDTIDISTNIPFQIGTDKIDMNSITEQKIALIIEQIRSNETNLVSIEVMTAFPPDGNIIYNKEVSIRRANAFADILRPHIEGMNPTATYIKHSWKDVANKLRELNHISVADSIEHIIENDVNENIITERVKRLPEYLDIIKPVFTQMRYTTCRLKFFRLKVLDSTHN